VKLTERQEMTPTEINAAIKAIRAGVDVFKGIKELSNKVANLEEDRAIHSMARAIHSMDCALFELEKELLAKNKEISQLKEQLASIDKPKLVDQLTLKGLLWFVESDEHQIPICRICTEEKDKYVYAINTPIGWLCPTCKAPMR